jgi:hypothetical protein
MSLIWLVGGTAALVLLYALYRAIAKHTGEKRMVRADDRSGREGVEESPENSSSNSSRIRAVDSEDFVQSCPEDLLFFDIWRDRKTLDPAWHRGAPISFDEFADNIPWIPLENKIVVRQIGGVDAHFLKRIADLPTEREILVLVDKSADLAVSARHEGGSR